ncbi:MAG: hypothetical protein V1936_03335 [Patescibacteria group bacterium]
MIYFEFSKDESKYTYDQVPGIFFGDSEIVDELTKKYENEKDLDNEKRNAPRGGMLNFLAQNDFIPVSENFFYKE